MPPAKPESSLSPTDLAPFRDLARQMQSLARRAVALHKPQVEALIVRNCQDANSIGLQLDHMLSFCHDPAMLDLYKKLCRHFWTVDPHATAEYVHAYREMWDTPEPSSLPAR